MWFLVLNSFHREMLRLDFLFLNEIVFNHLLKKDEVLNSATFSCCLLEIILPSDVLVLYENLTFYML